MNKSQLAIVSVSTRGTLEEKLDAYRAAGFSNVELALGDIRAYLERGRGIAELRQLLRERDLRCIGGFDGILRAFGPAESVLENRAQLRANAQLLTELGGANLVVGTDGPAPESGGDPLNALAEALARAADLTGELGVSVLLEFNWSPILKSLRTAVEVAQRSGAPNAGVLFDPAHYHCTPTKFEQITPHAVSYIRHVHLNDMADKPGELCNCNSDRVLPGQGCLDLKALLGALEAGGYRGLYSIEMFNEELWAMSSELAARAMYQSLLPLCEG